MDIGHRLKAVRTKAALSQRELAKRSGVTNGFISQIEKNQVSPSVASLRKVLEEKQASCIYAEPQFSPAVIESVARNTGARVLLLDEVGEQVPLGPDAYLQFMQQLAEAFAQCR